MERKRHAARLSLCAACLCLAAACKQADTSYADMLQRIDSGAAHAELFASAAELARSTEERLSVLKRARLVDTALYADTASRILHAGHVSEPVALAALDAYLADKRFDSAFTLFDTLLDKKTRQRDYCVLVVAAARAGFPLRLEPDALAYCADASSDPAFLVYAAVEAMTAGSVPLAETLLVDAQRMDPRRPISPRLLWDAGLYDALSVREPDAGDPLDVALCADACSIAGKFPEALTLYSYLIRDFPSWSWKPYAALAWLAEREASVPQAEWPHSLPPDSYEALSEPRAVAADLYERISERFGGSPDAVLERARWLYAHGAVEDAYTCVYKLGGKKGAAARLLYGPAARRVPDAMRLASEYPDDPHVNDAALASLMAAESWDNFMRIESRSQAAVPPRAWFWRAASLVISGKLEDAAAAIEPYAKTNYESAFNMGLLDLALHRYTDALKYFEAALSMSSSDEYRADAYIRLGDTYLASEKKENAAAAYRAALNAYPASTEARTRLNACGTP